MPMRVGAPSVRSDRRTSNRLERAEPPAAMAANSAFRRRVGRRATLAASDRQPGASLRSTASEHAAAGLRRHAGEEAVLTLACALLGLIRPLHACPKSFWWFIMAPPDNTRTAGRSASHVRRLEPVPDSVSDSIRRARKGVKRPRSDRWRAGRRLHQKHCPRPLETATLRRLPRPDAPHHRGSRRPERVQLRPRREPPHPRLGDGC